MVARVPKRFAFLVVAGYLLGGCAEALGQTDGFPDQLKAGCNTEDSCQDLVAKARAREARCMDNTIGYIRCSDARADEEIAQSLLRRQTALREKREEVERKRQQDDAEKREQARRDEELEAKKRAIAAEQKRRDDLDAQRKADEAARRAAAEQLIAKQKERLKLLGADGRVTELKQCFHEDASTCDALLSRLLDVADDEKEKAALVRLDQKLRGELQAQEEREAASQQGSGAGSVLCADGWASSCSCGGSLRGCCSHHGGVAGCR